MLRVNDHQDVGVGTNDVWRRCGNLYRATVSCDLKQRTANPVWPGRESAEEPALQQAEQERAWPSVPVSDTGERTEPGADSTADQAVDGRSADSFQRAGAAACPVRECERAE
jgi:hypothetical protein